MRILTILLLTLSLNLGGVVSAHAHLHRAEPAPGSVLATPPETVSMTFSMAIETRFSTLKVYKLELPDGAMPNDLANPSERERMRLEGLAGALVSEVLSARDDEDDPRRVDTGQIGRAHV